jgi:hypothetical protein
MINIFQTCYIMLSVSTEKCGVFSISSLNFEDMFRGSPFSSVYGGNQEISPSLRHRLAVEIIFSAKQNKCHTWVFYKTSH